jgi:CHAD domain-containing protein
MSYQLKKKEPVGKGICRVARQEIEKAIEALGAQRDGGAAGAVHKARKHFKKLRALLRLVRDELGQKNFDRENVSLRDAARQISGVRDAQVLVRSIEGFGEHLSAKEQPVALLKLRALFQREAQQQLRAVQNSNGLEDVIFRLREVEERVQGWGIDALGWSGLRGGVKRIYKRSRKAFRMACDDPGARNLHEWRKRTKALWYAVRLLRATSPDVMGELARELRTLSDFLGDDHDLVMLCARIKAMAKNGKLGKGQSLCPLIERRGKELKCAAFDLAERLFVPKPGAFADRIDLYRRGVAGMKNKVIPFHLAGRDGRRLKRKRLRKVKTPVIIRAPQLLRVTPDPANSSAVAPIT